MSGTAGKVALVSGSGALACGGTCAADPAVVDLVGVRRGATAFEGTGPAPAPRTRPRSRATRRTPHGQNGGRLHRGRSDAAELGHDPPTARAARSTPPSRRSRAPVPRPRWSGSPCAPTGWSRPPTRRVASTATSSRHPEPGGDRRLAHGLRRDLRVLVGDGGLGRRSAATSRSPAPVSEFNGLTEIDGRSRATWRRSPDAAPVTPAIGLLAGDGRRARVARVDAVPADGRPDGHEHLLAPTSSARSAWPSGRRPLLQTTEVARPGTPAAAAVAADNAARRRHARRRQRRSNFLVGRQLRLSRRPYISLTNPLRVGDRGDVHRAGRRRLPQQPVEAPADGARTGRRLVREHPDRRTRARRRRPEGRLVQRAQLLHHPRLLQPRRLHGVQGPHRRPGHRLGRLRPAWRVGRGRPAASAGQDRHRDQRPRRRRRRSDGDRELRGLVRRRAGRGGRHPGGCAQRRRGPRRLGLRALVDRAAARRRDGRDHQRDHLQEGGGRADRTVPRARHA